MPSPRVLTSRAASASHTLRAPSSRANALHPRHLPIHSDTCRRCRCLHASSSFSSQAPAPSLDPLSVSVSTSSTAALASYRAVLRATRIAFADDQRTLFAARAAARMQFDANRDVAPSPASSPASSPSPSPSTTHAADPRNSKKSCAEMVQEAEDAAARARSSGRAFETAEEGVAYGFEVARVLRENVVQGHLVDGFGRRIEASETGAESGGETRKAGDEAGKYKLRIHEFTEKGDNEVEMLGRARVGKGTDLRGTGRSLRMS